MQLSQAAKDSAGIDGEDTVTANQHQTLRQNFMDVLKQKVYYASPMGKRDET